MNARMAKDKVILPRGVKSGIDWDKFPLSTVYTRQNLPKPEKSIITYNFEGVKTDFQCFIFPSHGKIIIRNTDTNENKSANFRKNKDHIIKTIERLFYGKGE